MPSRISRLPDLGLLLVGQQDHHDVARGWRRRRRRAPRRPSPLGLRDRLASPVAQPDDHVDARVLQVERVGVALGAVAEDGDGLAVEQREVGVLVVDDVARLEMHEQPMSRSRSSFPARCAAARDARRPLGHLVRREARAAERAQLVVVPRRASAAPRSRPPPRCHSGSSRPCTPASATAGCSSSACSTSAGATFSPPVDDHVVGPPSTSGSPPRRGGRGRWCAASRPAQLAGRHARPANADQAVVLDPHSVVRIGGPARARACARPRPGGMVATCEAHSVRPYVGATGSPRPSARSSSGRGSGPPPSSAQRRPGERERRRRAAASASSGRATRSSIGAPPSSALRPRRCRRARASIAIAP